jgi:hypothetical protein
MSEIHHPTAPARSYQGRELQPTNPGELQEAIALAVDYRGDVTLVLNEGSSLEGYVFNHDVKSGNVSLFVPEEKKESTLATVPISRIRSIVFTGEDTAFGKSWEDWMAKSVKQRAEEAERQKQAARKMGIL